ncbi:hypothetical protein [Ectopseudomonas guguanensis]|jgi:hypothetical protein|uniref:hypothetical protein n=1 Tax=Ectopseudomonas guguanensis TaxID=1198456 RepID=UPI0012D57EE0|nr:MULTISPECIES: hypothetical protein [Pseudomonas]MDV5860558.1 hypothetical protein [Pseudomonas mendocina]MPT18426.1 hypothetical protein [Pseudomonas sp.]WJH58128.1 hypothetical protein FE254_19070 [Pseudomonas guguanensis]
MVKQLHLEIGELKRRADGITSAGVGLESIGQLLNNSDLDRDDRNGLEQAVIALGDYVRRVGYDLYAQAERLEGGAK